ncbi:MAG: LPS export ABC transporter periplasmic protein LptC [Candidatus Goldbacteria bacterium]|nr:LPS export ABC transporter periplasmic protein LptC [Candidatus Goldiibacteriota bacterium]
MKKIFIIFLSLVLCFLSACQKEKKIKPKLPVGENIEDIPNFIIEDFKLKSTEDGKIKMEIISKAAQIFEMKKKAKAQFVTVKFFEEDGKISVLYGDRAEINTETNAIQMNDNVVLKASNGIILKTNKLFWDDKEKKIFSDAEVEIIKDKNRIKGIGFESDSGLKNIKLKNKVELRARNLENEN